MKILYLPLDSRPCTYLYPIDVVKRTNTKILYPRIDIMDNYRIQSEYEDIFGFLKEAAPNADVAIIPLEQLIYGGVVGERSTKVTEEEAFERLMSIKELKKINPDLKIYITNMIMRLALSSFSTTEILHWELLNKYNFLICGDEEEVRQANEIRKQIPDEVMDTFLGARKRNHAVNMKVLDLLKEGVIEHINYLQEDSAIRGIHKQEQRQIIERAKELGVYDEIDMHNGADEMGAALLGMVMNNNFTLKVKWLHDNKNFVSCFEDRPFIENLNGFFKSCKIKEDENSEVELLIHTPKNEQSDWFGATKDLFTDEELDELVYVIGEECKTHKVALLDIAYCNGADDRLMNKLNEAGLLDKIYHYGGWNTSVNSLGVLLGELICMEKMSKKDQELVRNRHYLDEYIYQSIVRAKLDAYLEGNGIDHWNIGPVEEASEVLDKLMHEYPLKNIDVDYRAYLSWNRTFECCIAIKGADYER